MSHWFDRTQDAAKHGPLTLFQEQQLKVLEGTAWPTRKTEAWRYTSLFGLAAEQFAAPSAQLTNPVFADIATIDIIFDGQQWLLPSTLVSGLTIELVAVDRVLTKPDHHLFGLINDTRSQQSLSINVADSCQIEQPIRIVMAAQTDSEQFARVTTELGANAKCTVIEQLDGNSKGLSSLFCEYEVADSAHLNHYRFQLQGDQHYSIGGSHIRLASHSQLDSHIVGFGSKLSRLDIDVEHAGEHAQANLNAIFLLDGKEHFDLHTTIEHAKPNGTTEENVRGIVADHSKATFNGRIHIHRDAQKTLAELNNRNLLMSRNAELNTKPELEIYADDVRCAHGATVAELDEKSMYYLTSRGISRQDAQVMLNFGFINELVDQMQHEAIAEWLRPQLRQRFAQMKQI
ncbi:Fe-S cluster assembly protein SufD [Umboniibacter marinipuniceus]|uniref:Iron-regulated ABC transporter permease protein SufD n=1 Tax=Umboniibacter marinipuniceus TaxID=569599 RepID=A0A3M0A1E4_9GAMM|nr:Fe-S cluster assembly protein SufD [Umboniibacter marinipuniceus]RMA78773.1 iron-regulated ABC transporter permease protein SufD [Umboniibacter marinipuniceus]